MKKFSPVAVCTSHYSVCLRQTSHEEMQHHEVSCFERPCYLTVKRNVLFSNVLYKRFDPFVLHALWSFMPHQTMSKSWAVTAK